MRTLSRSTSKKCFFPQKVERGEDDCNYSYDGSDTGARRPESCREMFVSRYSLAGDSVENGRTKQERS